MPARPHRDIREDAVSEALFAVNLSRVGTTGLVNETTQEYNIERVQSREVLIVGHESRRVGGIGRTEASGKEVNYRKRYEISRWVNRPVQLCAAANPPGRSRNRSWR